MPQLNRLDIIVVMVTASYTLFGAYNSMECEIQNKTLSDTVIIVCSIHAELPIICIVLYTCNVN